jgi:HEAT repeat protein
MERVPRLSRRLVLLHALGLLNVNGAAAKGDVAGLIFLLEHAEQPAERAAATEALVTIGAPAVQPLIAALVQGERRDQQAHLEALIRIGAPAIDGLMTALMDRDSWERGAIICALEGYEAHFIELLLFAFRPGDAWQHKSIFEPAEAALRQSAGKALGRSGDARAVAPLIAALREEDLAIRQVAAWGLARLGAPAVEPLIAALRDPHARVRWAAASILGRFGDGRAVEPLTVALQDDHAAVRRNAVLALGHLGDRCAIAPLQAVFDVEANIWVRLAAAWALRRLRAGAFVGAPAARHE